MSDCLFVCFVDTDVDECADGNNGDGCSYRCRNINGGFFCQCPADGPPTPSALCVGRSAVRDDCFAMPGSVYLPLTAPCHSYPTIFRPIGSPNRSDFLLRSIVKLLYILRSLRSAQVRVVV